MEIKKHEITEHTCDDCGLKSDEVVKSSMFKKWLCNICFKKNILKFLYPVLATLIIIIVITFKTSNNDENFKHNKSRESKAQTYTTGLSNRSEMHPTNNSCY